MAAGHIYQRKWILVRLPIAVLALAAMALLWRWLLPMPPTTLTLSAGMPGGVYHAHAQRYAERFAAYGVTLRVQPSEGALQNLRRLRALEAPAAQLAFVQGGMVVTGSGGEAGARLQTIARVDFEPLWIFTRLQGIDALQQLQGRRVSLGPAASGTRQLAITLLAQARMAPSDLVDSQLAGTAALDALRHGQLDAVVMVMAAGAPLVRQFLQLPGVQLVQLGRSAALIERLPWLQARLLPAGALDPLARLPSRDTTLLVTTASLLAPAGLPPALQRLAAAVAREVHQGAGLFHRAGDLPSLRRIEYPASAEARQTLAHGLPLLERTLPFWWAQVTVRLLAICLPVALLALWLARLVPAWLRWQLESRMTRWYGELKYIEHDLERDRMPGRDLARHLDRLHAMSQRLHAFTPPPDLLPRWFTLRQHIGFVQQSLQGRRGR